MTLQNRSSIRSKTTENDAPSRARTGVLGTVECHYATDGNLNERHPEQQDRASIYLLPGVKPSHFDGVITEAFRQMREVFKDRCFNHGNRYGNACATIAMLDPVLGKLAIGSKGDCEAYLVIHPKGEADGAPIIQRISSHYKVMMQELPKGIKRGPMMVDFKHPPMWAAQDSWKQRDVLFFDDNLTPPVPFQCIDVRQLATSIIKNRQNTAASGSINLKDYDLSIVIASDGITSGAKLDNEQLLDRLARAMGKGQNCAESLLNAAIQDPTSPSRDNLSAIIFHNLSFGSGSTVAGCIVDGNHQANMEHVHEGSAMSQALIDSFERYMQRIREAATDISQTGHASQLPKNKGPQERQ